MIIKVSGLGLIIFSGACAGLSSLSSAGASFYNTPGKLDQKIVANKIE